MTELHNGRNIIGRVEKISLPLLGVKGIPAKVDTGADASSIWCSKAEVKDGELNCIFFGPGSEFYDGEPQTFGKNEFTITQISNSFGDKETRFKVKIPIKIKGRRIRATFTLADRSKKVYPILIGRATLRGKFIVDVSKGKPLRDREKLEQLRIEKELRDAKKELLL